MSSLPANTVPEHSGERNLPIGHKIGRFELESLLGTGGMGIVFAARDPVLERRVAIKVLWGDRGERATARLLREAQALARVAHINVVTVFEAGSFEAGAYIAMELVEGVTLRDWLVTPRSTAEIVAMFIAAGRGLAAIHAAGLVHRDFKPTNVLVDRADVAKVSDLGVVATANERADTLIGTLSYMAPEQTAGKPVDARTDQYAFCTALGESFGGRPPRHLASIVERGTALSPRDRYPSMIELLAALAARQDRRSVTCAAEESARSRSGSTASLSRCRAAWPRGFDSRRSVAVRR